ncbi:MAG: TIGR02206 family membrane protein [Verrucomicrobiae bacterium]|nr:TIGR02206 family membrane protein [Verrucomicrobiae bacterium]NNJ41763.1 TIGR02206 family membrane protein [Akkermansiaceae bacterium]
MDSRVFTAFGVAHCTALAVTAGAAIGLVMLARSSASEKIKRRAEVSLGVLLLLSVLADPLTNWLRYAYEPGGSTAQALEIMHQNSYPFYLCDVVAIVLAVALFKRSQRLAEVGYLWGVAGTFQGLITPTLYFSWDAPEYYAFFLQHGGVPVAGLLLVFGLKLRPEKGAFKRILIWSWSYMAIVIVLNALLSTNYGFLNSKPGVPTLFDYMGPHPWYLVTVHLIAYLLFGLLLLPFFHRPFAWKR